jgi:hypothetical protein
MGMKNRYFLKLFLSVALILGTNEYGLATYDQQPALDNHTGPGGSAIVSKVFNSSIPAEYQMLQAGTLTDPEGDGEFLILAATSSKTKVVIISLDNLSWLKTKEIESTNSAKVGKQLVSRFFPEAGPVSIAEDKQESSPSQYAPHLRVAISQGVIEPAIALRLLYPKNKAYILFLWQQDKVQNFPMAYQQLENQAKNIISGLRAPSTKDSRVSERYILWRLRHIFKKGVFTHLVEPKNNE